MLNEGRYNLFANTFSTVFTLTDYDRHIFLPKGNITDRLPFAVLIDFDEIKLAFAIEVIIHIRQGFVGIRFSFAINEQNRFGILIPFKGKIILSVKTAEAESFFDL